MRRTLLSGLAAAALIAAAPQPAHAKGPTVRIVLICQWSARAIEISDSGIARQFGPFNNGFFQPAGGDATPAAGAKPCQAFFFANMGQGKVMMMYTATYVPGADGQPGSIRLPAPGEPWSAMNASTYRRPELEGRWLRATAAW